MSGALSLIIHVTNVLIWILQLWPGISSLAKVHIVANHLDELNLSLASSLRDLYLQISTLGHLSLVGCQQLNDDNCRIQCDRLGTIDSSGTDLSL